MRRWQRRAILAVVVLACVTVVTFFACPWPGALVLRQGLEAGAAETAERLEKHVPPGIDSRFAISYDSEDPDALLDIYRPEGANGPLPAIVWVHGGGWISGSRSDVGNYLKILAGEGFATVSIDYSIAPEAHYPRPVWQVMTALAFLVREGPRLGIDPSRMVIAGDSAGAQIAAQVANILVDPTYAARTGTRAPIETPALRGAILFGGFYDLVVAGRVDSLGMVPRSMLWSYSGDFSYYLNHAFVAGVSVRRYLAPRFPPSFVSTGNADPLIAQSFAMVTSLAVEGIPVETLFFGPEHDPPLGHDYQFDLDTDAGREALSRVAAFARRVTR